MTRPRPCSQGAAELDSRQAGLRPCAPNHTASLGPCRPRQAGGIHPDRRKKHLMGAGGLSCGWRRAGDRGRWQSREERWSHHWSLRGMGARGHPGDRGWERSPFRARCRGQSGTWRWSGPRAACWPDPRREVKVQRRELRLLRWVRRRGEYEGLNEGSTPARKTN